MKKSGYILPYVLLILLIVTLLLYTLGESGIRLYGRTIQLKNISMAEYASLAGVERALYSIETDPKTITETKGAVSFDKVPSLWNQKVGEPLGEDIGAFTVRITNNSGASEAYASQSNVGAPVDAISYDGIHVPPGRIYISSEGTVGHTKRHTNVMLELMSAWNFPYALFANEGITIQQDFSTDSYFLERPDNDESIWNRSKGDIGINVTSSEESSINLNGSTSLKGAIWLGTTGKRSAINSRGALYCNGDYNCDTELSSLWRAQSFPNIVSSIIPNDVNNIQAISGNTTLNSGSYGLVEVNGGELTFDCKGTNKTLPNYVMVRSLVVDRGTVGLDDSCTDQNPIILFVCEKLEIPNFNSIINYSYDAGRLVILGMPSLTQVIISGGPQNPSSAAYALYAPKATIEIRGGGHIYGSIVGKKIVSTGMLPLFFHFEEDLLELPLAHIGNRFDVKIKSWSTDY